MGARHLIFIVCVCLMAGTAMASPRSSLPRLSRIRAADDGVSRLIEAGLDRSVTIRRLIAEIETGDVFVYLTFDSGLSAKLAGRLKFMGAGKKYRYVYVTIRRHLPSSDAISILGHELEHVREILVNPQVRDHESLEQLYRQIGDEHDVDGRRSIDTVGARRTGETVRREIR